MTERWKPVVGFEELYEVSDHGNVRSVDRPVPSSNQHGSFVYKSKGRELKLKADKDGYLRVDLCRKGQMSQRKVHRLVLEAFEGTCPDGHQACHYDDDPSNNRLSNLRWDSPSANNLDMVRNGNHINARKTHCPKGHEYDDKNTRLYRGRRYCRECHRARKREAYKARKRREAHRQFTGGKTG